MKGMSMALAVGLLVTPVLGAPIYGAEEVSSPDQKPAKIESLLPADMLKSDEVKGDDKTTTDGVKKEDVNKDGVKKGDKVTPLAYSVLEEEDEVDGDVDENLNSEDGVTGERSFGTLAFWGSDEKKDTKGDDADHVKGKDSKKVEDTKKV